LSRSALALAAALAAITPAGFAAGAGRRAATVAAAATTLDEAAEEALDLRARTLFAAGEYQQAVEVYARLYAETLHPTYLRNVGRCQQNLGQPDRAIASFREYLRKARGVDRQGRAEIEGYIREMEALAQRRAAAPVAAAPPAPRASASEGEGTAAPAEITAQATTTPIRDEARPAGPVALFLRADVGVRRAERGVVLLPGLSLALSRAFELSAAAFLGHHKGGLAGARLLLLPGGWRPNLSLAVLMLWPARAEGSGRELRPGVQLGPGLRRDLGRHLALAIDLTGTFLPGAGGDLGSLWLVPSLSVQGRL
jgi:tetratricopeptide (TPR) repeat protein